MGKYDDVMFDYDAYINGFDPYHSGPDMTEEQIRIARGGSKLEEIAE
jgi:hypothetical protein